MPGPFQKSEVRYCLLTSASSPFTFEFMLIGNVQTNGMRSLNLGGYDVNRRLQTFIQDNHKETIKNYEKGS